MSFDLLRNNAAQSKEIREASEQLNAASAQSRRASDAIDQSARSIGAFSGQFGEATGGLLSLQEDLRQTLLQLTGSLDTFLQGYSESTTLLASAAKPMSGAAEELSLQSSRLTEASLTVATGQDALLRALADERDSQDNLTRSVSEATIGLEQALLAIQRHSNLLSELTSDAGVLASSVPDYAKTIRGHLEEAAHAQEQAAAVINAAVQNLGTALRSRPDSSDESNDWDSGDLKPAG